MDWHLLREVSRRSDSSPDVEERLAIKRIVATSAGWGYGMVFMFLGIFLFGIMFYAQYSGALRWVLVFLLFTAAGTLLLRFVNVRARDPAMLVGATAAVDRRPGEVLRFAALLERSAEGLKYSQIEADERLRKAVLDRVRVARGLGREEIEAARESPAGLHGLLKDKALVLWCLRGERDTAEWPMRVGGMPRRPAFWAEFQDALRRGEALE